MSDLASTQSHLKIAGIEEGVIILRDGSLAIVMQVMPINFGLKNELEQNAIIAKFQSFLNSLEFPVQVVIRSKRLDLEPYLIDLEQRVASQTNELLQIQSEDYISFMRNLVQVANIMSKSYYVVLSYKRVDASTAKTGLVGVFKHSGPAAITRSQFDTIRNELNSHANNVAAGLVQMGLGVNALDTQQLIELFYMTYNPDISATERLAQMEMIQADVISSGQNTPPAPAEPVKHDAINLSTSDTATDINKVAAVATVSEQAQQQLEATGAAGGTGSPITPNAPTADPAEAAATPVTAPAAAPAATTAAAPTNPPTPAAAQTPIQPPTQPPATQ